MSVITRKKTEKRSVNKVSSINRFRDILKVRNWSGADGKNLNKNKFLKKIMIQDTKKLYLESTFKCTIG